MADRRLFLRRLAALPAASAVASLPAIAMVTATDPWVALGLEHFRRADAVEAACGDEAADAAFDAWGDVERQMLGTRPTTLAGALAGLRVALDEYRRFHLTNHDDENAYAGDRFMVALLSGAIGVLEREVANV